MKPLISRTLSSYLLQLAQQFPVLVLLGPRQSGKTTLARSLFTKYRYINLEAFDEQDFAQNDPRGFLARFYRDEGIILDEIQKTPRLLSYIQLEVDENPIAGRFVLTGSHNILLNQQISQTLAGRAAFTTLLPLSIEELREAERLPDTLQELLLKGCYPRLYQGHVNPVVFAESYTRTYIERDVRDIKQISSISDFQRFMRLCAARIGQLLNMSALANEAGISLATVKAWLSLLETSYVIFLLQPHHANFNKRLVKMPKLYFYDTGIACHLLRLTKPEDVYDHYLRGNLFESLIIAEFMKKRYHRTLPPNAYFWRDKLGDEVDCILEEGANLKPIEIKSAATISTDMLAGLAKWSKLSGTPLQKASIIYGGELEQKRDSGHFIPWRLP